MAQYTITEQNSVVGANNGQIMAYLMPTEEINVSASYDKLPEGISCQCVDFIKEYYNGLQNKELKYPEYLWNNFDKYGLEKTEAQKGALVILPGHIAVVEKVIGDQIQIVEKNHIPCRTGKRIIDIKNAIGFLK